MSGRFVNFAYRVPLVLIYLTIQVTSCPSSCNCTDRPRGGVAYHCTGLNSTADLFIAPTQAIRELHVTSSPIKSLDPSDLGQLRNLRIFSWTNGELKDFDGAFPETLIRLEVLNISRNHLHWISPDILRPLINLRVIDISLNNFSKFSDPLLQNEHIKKVYISGNPLNCNSPWDIQWLLEPPVPLVDFPRLLCATEFSGHDVGHVVRTWQKMDTECPKDLNCTCQLTKFVPNTKGPSLPVIDVNCSNQGLPELPGKLPASTNTLDVRNNQVSDLTPLLENEYYRSVLVLYLDNNNIQSINILEGSDWLNNFRLLSLSGNKLVQLPTYMLDNALEKNPNALHMYFGNNPWRCDCISGPTLQTWIAKHQTLLKDIMEIKCAAEPPLKHVSGQRVASLSRADICKEETTGLSTLDIVNVLLASLIVLVIGKLVYDYWSFRRTGQLPWLVSKMP